MVYDFIRSQAQHYPVMVMCKALTISRSCYYAYLKGGNVCKEQEKKGVEEQVIKTFTAHRRRYGVRRMVPELRDLGLKIGHYKVSWILRKYGLKAIQPRSFVPRTTNSRHPYPISPNLLQGQAFPTLVNQVWVGDITYIPLKDRQWGYLATWMDLFSRKVTGWQLYDHMREELVMEAFKKSWGNRNAAEGLIIHSDRGGQYAGKKFRQMLSGHRLLQSMSGKDNPYDNAFMESHFSRVKAELLQGGVFDSLEDAQTEIFEFIEMYYNPIRRHSSLGYISPVAFERLSSQQKQEV